MDGDDSGFYILAGERARNEKRPRLNGAQLLRLMDNLEDPRNARRGSRFIGCPGREGTQTDDREKLLFS